MTSVVEKLKTDQFSFDKPKKAHVAAPPQKKREAKEEEKKCEFVRKSTRKVEHKPIYDEKEIEKLLNESENKGNGCIDVMLAENYKPDVHDCTGWLMSEKLDGVRCYWNGKNMFTRNGNKFYAPDWWTDKLPKIALDGELWSDRNAFQSIVSIVRKQDKTNEKWKEIKFMVFDAPLVKTDFSKRLALLEKSIDPVKHSVVQLVEQTVCQGPDQLAQ